MTYEDRIRTPLALALLAATYLTPPGSVQAAPGDAMGPEFQVNTYTFMSQSWPDVAMDADGDFVVAWVDYGFKDGSYSGVFAQRFDAAGVAQGPEFQVNTTTHSFQEWPKVAMDADGDFVVAYVDYSGGPATQNVFAQRFDAEGVIQGQEIQVNTTELGAQRAASLAMDSDGDFVVVWEDLGVGDGSYSGIFGQRFDAKGEPQGGEFLVNTTTASSQDRPAVAMDAYGNFVVAWEHSLYGGRQITAQRFNAAGVPQGGEITVGGGRTPAVAMDADGDFLVTWTKFGSFTIWGRRFDAAGIAQGPDFLISSFAGGTWSSVAMDSDGDTVVAWHGSTDGHGSGVFARRYDAAGSALGPEFQVNTSTIDHQLLAEVAMDADGDFVVAWETYDHVDGSYAGILAQRYQGAGPVANDFTVDGRSDILWRASGSGSTDLWRMDGFAVEATGSIGAPGTEWQVAGLADFNADTKTDVLWRHTGDGKAVIWLMDGYTKLGSGGIGGAGPDWRIVGTGDFDGDDHADILWRNITSGVTVIWKMDGLSKEATAGLGVVPSAWQVAGVGDFDADATSDLLWRNTDNGATVAWKMKDLAKDSSAPVGGAPGAWQVEGLADFDADAKSDILWRNTETGGTVVWKMDGLAKAGSAPIGKPPLIWDLEGAGDTGGDRQADILWRHADTGRTVIWQMDGFAKVDSQAIGTVPADWEVQ